MKRRNAASDKRRRKMITILWTAVLAIGTIVLIYKEMTAVLYIVATLGVTVLLVLVAMADLSPAEKLTNDPRPSDDSAAIGSGMTSTFGAKPS
jgi:membrane protein required for beta-lactamase induction